MTAKISTIIENIDFNQKKLREEQENTSKRLPTYEEVMQDQLKSRDPVFFSFFDNPRSNTEVAILFTSQNSRKYLHIMNGQIRPWRSRESIMKLKRSISLVFQIEPSQLQRISELIAFGLEIAVKKQTNIRVLEDIGINYQNICRYRFSPDGRFDPVLGKTYKASTIPFVFSDYSPMAFRSIREKNFVKCQDFLDSFSPQPSGQSKLTILPPEGKSASHFFRTQDR